MFLEKLNLFECLFCQFSAGFNDDGLGSVINQFPLLNYLHQELQYRTFDLKLHTFIPIFIQWQFTSILNYL